MFRAAIFAILAAGPVACSLPAQAQNVPADFGWWERPGWDIKPPVTDDRALVNVPCFGPESASKVWPPVTTAPKVGTDLPGSKSAANAPDFQAAYNGTYVALDSLANYLDYLQPESGTGLTAVNLRFEVGSWMTAGFEVAPGTDEVIVNLYDSQFRRVGAVKLCTATISQNGSTLCTNIHLRAAVGGRVVIPPVPGFDLQRMEDLNAANGSGLVCVG